MYGILAITMAGFLPSPHAKAGEAVTVNFMERNTLDTEDAGFMTGVSQDEFNSIIQAALTAYHDDAQSRGETLTINARWEDPTVNANCSRIDGTVTINMYGGLARRNEVTPDTFALVLCHELGHAYGGTPYIRPAVQIAAEGQADYYGMQVCMRRLLAQIPSDSNALAPDELISDRCTTADDPTMCTRRLIAGENIAHLFAAIKHTDVPSYTTPDTSVVTQTELSYPKTVQCRIDTYYNAVLNLPRPACWFHI